MAFGKADFVLDCTFVDVTMNLNICVLLALVVFSDGFSVRPELSPNLSRSSLKLRPDQGEELALAFENGCRKGMSTMCSDTQKAQARLIAVSRRCRGLFRFLTHFPFKFLHLFRQYKDFVLYPIIGFTFVKDRPNHCNVLPNASNPSYGLFKPNEDEVEIGWFRPSSATSIR